MGKTTQASIDQLERDLHMDVNELLIDYGIRDTRLEQKVVDLIINGWKEARGVDEII